MYVISGKYKGHKIKGYKLEGTRASMARLRESLFAMLNPYLDNAIVLDLFAGTGSLGLEAISNGAGFVFFNDSNALAIKACQSNLEALKETRYKASILDYKRALKHYLEEKIVFDIVFLDPPYDMHIIEDLQEELLKILNDKALLVCEISTKYNPIINSHYKLLKEKKYGDKKVLILEKR